MSLGLEAGVSPSSSNGCVTTWKVRSISSSIPRCWASQSPCSHPTTTSGRFQPTSFSYPRRIAPFTRMTMSWRSISRPRPRKLTEPLDPTTAIVRIFSKRVSIAAVSSSLRAMPCNTGRSPKWSASARRLWLGLTGRRSCSKESAATTSTSPTTLIVAAVGRIAACDSTRGRVGLITAHNAAPRPRWLQIRRVYRSNKTTETEAACACNETKS